MAPWRIGSGAERTAAWRKRSRHAFSSGVMRPRAATKQMGPHRRSATPGDVSQSILAMSERLYVLDAPGYVYRAYHALPYLSTSRGVPSHVVLGMSTMVWKLLREERPEYFAAAWDPPGPTFREQRFAAYKETRPAMADDLRVQIPYVRRLFEAMRVPVLEVSGFEADDVLATMVANVRDLPVEVMLVTSDK